MNEVSYSPGDRAYDQKLSDNLRTILSKGIQVEDLVAVRAIDNGNLNREGTRFYAGPTRGTLHFALNHMVDISKVYSDWSGSDTVMLTPFGALLESNPDNFAGGSTVDVFCVGYADLPTHEIVSRKGENDKEFRKKVDQAIEKMGYMVMPGRNHAWGGSGWEPTDQFADLLKTRGYNFVAHNYTPFNTADRIDIGVNPNTTDFRVDWIRTLASRYEQGDGQYDPEFNKILPFILEWFDYWNQRASDDSWSNVPLEGLLSFPEGPYQGL